MALCLLAAGILSIGACSPGSSTAEDSPRPNGSVAVSAQPAPAADETLAPTETPTPSPSPQAAVAATSKPDPTSTLTPSSSPQAAVVATSKPDPVSTPTALSSAAKSPTTTPTATSVAEATPTGEPPDDESGLLSKLKRSAREALLKLVPDWQDEGRINILLLGIDKQDTREGNTDVMMLASIDPGTKSALLLSIPRDLCIDDCETYLDRLNGVYEREGPNVLKEHVSEILGLPVDFFAAVNFNGFAEAIDLLGGIEFWVERDFDELFEFLETREQLRLRLDSGWHELTGREALLLARSRQFDPGGDFARICRQQQLVRQIREKAVSIQIVPRIPELMLGLGEWFETDFPVASMPSFAELAVTIPSSRLHSQAITDEDDMLETITGTDGAHLLRPDLDLIHDFVDQALLQSVSEKPGGVPIYCPVPPPR